MRPRIWSVSTKEGREIWNGGGSFGSWSEISSSAWVDCESDACGGLYLYVVKRERSRNAKPWRG